ncbi:MAG: NAD(P)-dependent oxidoreductase [Planctomycetota bacterium]|nr:NAD(P)-dependent oxidoreductase [Planctomycetota bacterium]
MKVLMIGSAGYVGSIIRPAIEAEHDVWHYDRRPVPRAGRRGKVADVLDERSLRLACRNKDAIVYLALGVRPGGGKIVSDPQSAFDVNVLGVHQTLYLGLRAGVRRFVITSSLSVYNRVGTRHPLFSERTPADSFHTYGFTKRVGEFIADAAAQSRKSATVVSLRLMWPRTEEDWPQGQSETRRYWYPTGPQDTRDLFLAALRCKIPGSHIIQATGDVKQRDYSHRKAKRLLGWKAQGR